MKSVEDHGYILDFGIEDTSGFLAFKDVKRSDVAATAQYHVGQLLDITISKSTKNNRTFNVKIDLEQYRTSSASHNPHVMMNVANRLHLRYRRCRA